MTDLKATTVSMVVRMVDALASTSAGLVPKTRTVKNWMRNRHRVMLVLTFFVSRFTMMPMVYLSSSCSSLSSAFFSSSLRLGGKYLREGSG